MSDEHIVFEDLEPEDRVDADHLEQCEECRRQWRAHRFLAWQVRSLPRMEAPPFFAARVAHLAGEFGSPFLFVLQRAARQLIPVFVALVLATGFLFYRALESGTEDLNSEILFEQPAPQVSGDYILSELAQGEE